MYVIARHRNSSSGEPCGKVPSVLHRSIHSFYLTSLPYTVESQKFVRLYKQHNHATTLAFHPHSQGIFFSIMVPPSLSKVLGLFL